MNYYRETQFVDQYWQLLIELLAVPKQLENTQSCLSLLTTVDVPYVTTQSETDEYKNALNCVRSVKKYLRSCIWEEKRLQCIHVVIISIYDADRKNELISGWKRLLEMYYPDTKHSEHTVSYIQVLELSFLPHYSVIIQRLFKSLYQHARFSRTGSSFKPRPQN